MGRTGEVVERLAEIVKTLRSPGGCPWDREQTLESIRSGLIEETYEVYDAIENGDRKCLREELGDVLLQVVFQSRICEEEGSFDLADVAESVSEKLVRRHPHVFGDVKVSGTDEVLKNWDAIKKAEKGETESSILDGIPRSLPALQRAWQMQKRAARAGFDWEDVSGVLDKIREETEELTEAAAAGNRDEVEEELGDLLFSLVNLSRFLGVNPEEALDRTVRKFAERFRVVERKVRESGRDFADFSIEELDRFWEEAKRERRSGGKPA